jgi:transcriptional regulator with XRE-family HTH domain
VKINQTQIAKLIGISQPYLSEILGGKKRPSWKTAKRLAEATGTAPVLWMDGTPDEIKAALSGGHRQACQWNCVSNNACACEA